MADPKGVLVVRNFLPLAQCRRLSHLYEIYCRSARGEDYNRRPVVHLTDVPEEARGEFKAAAYRVIHRVRTRTRLPLMFEAVFLARIETGHVHPLHRDNCKPDGSPNHTPNRDYSSLVYLNSDFTGGEIEWPGRGKLQPKAGMLVAFPSGYDFPHEVWPVLSGVRYSMPVWMTLSPEHSLKIPE